MLLSKTFVISMWHRVKFHNLSKFYHIILLIMIDGYTRLLTHVNIDFGCLISVARASHHKLSMKRMRRFVGGAPSSPRLAILISHCGRQLKFAIGRQSPRNHRRSDTYRRARTHRTTRPRTRVMTISDTKCSQLSTTQTTQ